jgi:hypothetical protein
MISPQNRRPFNMVKSRPLCRRECSEAPEHGVLILASAPRRKRMIGANNVRPALILFLNCLHALPIA